MSETSPVPTRSLAFPGGLVLESGARLAPVTVAYETYGRLNQEGDNAVLVLHALTGDAHASGLQGCHPQPGWWEPLIGPGCPLDTERYFVVCSNVLGGCYGTTGPSSLVPDRGRPYGLSFPVITIRDMVNLQKMLLDTLGVKGLVTALGGSMGGMHVLEWAVSYPDFLRSAIPIATSAKLSAQGIAYNEAQRQAIRLDPGWRGGDYYGGPGPAAGLALARMIGTITYKSDPSWDKKFGRAFGGQPEELFQFSSRFEVENYLHYQGDKLVKRFDANSYLYLTKAMDLHDLARGRGPLTEVWRQVRARVLSIGISSDFLYPAYQQKEIARGVKAAGGRADYLEIESPYGHDAFLIEFEQVSAAVRSFLADLD